MNNLLYVGRENTGKTSLINNIILDNYPAEKILFFSEDTQSIKKERGLTIVPITPVLRGYFEDYYTNEDIIVYDTISSKFDLKTVLDIVNHVKKPVQIIATMTLDREVTDVRRYLDLVESIWGIEAVTYFNRIYKTEGVVRSGSGVTNVIVPLKDEILAQLKSNVR